MWPELYIVPVWRAQSSHLVWISLKVYNLGAKARKYISTLSAVLFKYTSVPFLSNRTNESLYPEAVNDVMGFECFNEYKCWSFISLLPGGRHGLIEFRNVEISRVLVLYESVILPSPSLALATLRTWYNIEQLTVSVSIPVMGWGCWNFRRVTVLSPD